MDLEKYVVYLHRQTKSINMKKIIEDLQKWGATLIESKNNGSTYLEADYVGLIRVSNHNIRPAGLVMKSRFGLEIIYKNGDYRVYTAFDVANKVDDFIEANYDNNECLTEEEVKEIIDYIFTTYNNLHLAKDMAKVQANEQNDFPQSEQERIQESY